MSTTSLPVEQISDTAFLTALYRAMEGERSDAHFQDTYARILAGERGEQLGQLILDVKSVALGCAVRTCVFDELILQVVKNYSIDIVFNLGSGFDTRPYRLPLPTSLSWIESDLPIVLNYKADKLGRVQPVCSLKSVPCNLTDAIARQKLWRNIKTTMKQGLVITEGLLVYLTSEQVAALAIDLYQQTKLRWWLCDMASPFALQQMQKLLSERPTGGAINMQFAPEYGVEFFRKYGWEPIELRSYFEEAQRLNRGTLSEQLLSQLDPVQWQILRQMSSFVLLTHSDL
ncbi:MAG: class I SAM-dependent methyltransferase [Coleofasciculus sp.]